MCNLLGLWEIPSFMLALFSHFPVSPAVALFGQWIPWIPFCCRGLATGRSQNKLTAACEIQEIKDMDVLWQWDLSFQEKVQKFFLSYKVFFFSSFREFHLRIPSINPFSRVSTTIHRAKSAPPVQLYPRAFGWTSGNVEADCSFIAGDFCRWNLTKLYSPSFF